MMPTATLPSTSSISLTVKSSWKSVTILSQPTTYSMLRSWTTRLITGQTGDPVLQGIDGVKGYELLGYELDNTKGVQKNSVSGHRGTDITTLFGGKSLPGRKSIGGNNVLDISSNGSELLWIAAPQKNNPWLQKNKNRKTRILNRLGF